MISKLPFSQSLKVNDFLLRNSSDFPSIISHHKSSQPPSPEESRSTPTQITTPSRASTSSPISLVASSLNFRRQNTPPPTPNRPHLSHHIEMSIKQVDKDWHYILLSFALYNATKPSNESIGELLGISPNAAGIRWKSLRKIIDESAEAYRRLENRENGVVVKEETEEGSASAQASVNAAGIKTFKAVKGAKNRKRKKPNPAIPKPRAGLSGKNTGPAP
ncbi:hypothetical protein VTL71DRAFT_16038 [Oculimacula yallundae]|uniref:Uncharacterized protein n=1 Tax=Oculimacula yallundae TaxID=86028 RepID=A0ABR4CDB8_9HELO